ncbi:MAG: aspartate dehydrogenase [Chloroflexi bacterium]|nr:aspartate dehydrogenase [Chloroflexota bacterium]
MASVVKIGLLGFGTIGRRVAELVREGKAGETELVAVLVRDPARVAPETAARYGVKVMVDAADFLDTEMDLVVEAAGQQALHQYAEWVLRANKHLMAISVGAFADAEFLARVRHLAHDRGRQVLVPSGAIAGLDAISAAALSELEEVTHTTRKPPRAFTAEQLKGIQPTEPTLLYDGPAREGVRLFPENVNVAAAVSLAGIGLERTRLRVIADPTVVRNTHEVEVRGFFGQLRLVIENIPTENPRTGRIVALSIAKALRNLSAPVVIGV